MSRTADARARDRSSGSPMVVHASLRRARWRQMRELLRMTFCLTVAGNIDYILLVRSRDVAHYQDFARHVLATAPGIRSYPSEIVLEVPKWTTEVPMEDE